MQRTFLTAAIAALSSLTALAQDPAQVNEVQRLEFLAQP